jgi:hypothetical protein
MTDKLRAAAQAVLETLDILSKLGNGDVDGDSVGNEIAQDARQNLRAALAEPAIKESLTVAEPVAWKHPDKNMVFWEDTKKVDEYHGFKLTIPLYAAPPRREWVGLTREELAEIFANCDLEERGAVAWMVEVKLRNKNT